MEDNKYYIPEIQEFHEGFEWEQYISGSGNDYQKMVFSLKDVNFIANCYERNLEDGWIRVAYLSKEDIEAEGFTYNKHHISEDFWKGNKDNEVLIEMINDGKLCIRHRINGMLESEIIGIKIKNRSELRRILKMIGV